MRTLEKQFISSPDGTKDHQFTQIFRGGDKNNIAIYKRVDLIAKKVLGYEVFLIKTRLKGQALPGGNFEAEDRECYPGKTSFGRTAFFCVTTEQAKKCVDKLKVMTHETEDEEIVDLILPKTEFTIKELLVGNAGWSYLNISLRIKELSEAGKVKKVGERKAGRGKPANVFKSI